MSPIVESLRRYAISGRAEVLSRRGNRFTH